MVTIALLPMKANSQRVKGKNFREFLGKPLFRWILDTLLSVKEIDKVVINTDARAVLAQNGLTDSDRVLIRDRRPEICGDDVSMNLVLADDIASMPADLYVMTHTTNPLLGARTIQDAINFFAEARGRREADSLFTVDRIQNRFYRADCSAINHDPGRLIPTQDLEPWFQENSNLYMFTSDSFRVSGARIGKRPVMYETPRLESLDIDTPDDWDLALAAARLLSERGAIHRGYP